MQVKHFGADSGTGGDWAVRVSATKAVLSKQEARELAAKAANARGGRPAARKGAPKRISLVMYLGDEGQPTQQWQVSWW